MSQCAFADKKFRGYPQLLCGTCCVMRIVALVRCCLKDGGLCGGLAFGGEGIQRALLEEEGVVFLPDGRVDMARCGWLK